jgi:hypothetical protein
VIGRYTGYSNGTIPIGTDKTEFQIFEMISIDTFSIDGRKKDKRYEELSHMILNGELNGWKYTKSSDFLWR